jgi:hypothetical protein
MDTESHGRDARSSKQARVGGATTCDHAADDRSYLGHMGTARFYECTVCGGVVVEW